MALNIDVPTHCQAGHALTATNTAILPSANHKSGYRWECKTCRALLVTRRLRQNGFHIEPNENQKERARAARDLVTSYGWSISFFPHRPYGDRTALKDPGNKGRLGGQARQKYTASKAVIEVLMERGYALQKTRIKKGNGFIDTDATTFASRALELFPGSRIVLSSPLQHAVERAMGHRLKKGPNYRKTSTASGRAHREAIIACFHEFQKQGMFPPTFWELAAACGLTSVATVSHHVGVLVKDGLLAKHRRHYVLKESLRGET